MDIYAIQALHGLVYGMLLFMVASGLIPSCDLLSNS